MDYRTRDGLTDYGFSIEHQQGGGWRVYVIFHPFRQGDKVLNLPYGVIDDKGRRYVDWPAELASLGEAKTVAGLWAELVETWRRAQEQRRLYVELIERYLQIQERRMAGLAGRDLPAETVDAGQPDLPPRDRDPAIPAAAAPEPLSNPKKSQRALEIRDKVAWYG